MQTYILISLAAWNIALTIVIFFIFQKFNRLTKDVPEGNLIKILDSVLAKEEKNTQIGGEIVKRLERHIEESKVNVKKVGLVRFNPFNELGGDHSFALAMLDGLENGFILTGLHTREKTRMYIKKVKNSKSEIDLSKEEKKALDIALKVQ